MAGPLVETFPLCFNPDIMQQPPGWLNSKQTTILRLTNTNVTFYYNVNFALHGFDDWFTTFNNFRAYWT